MIFDKEFDYPFNFISLVAGVEVVRRPLRRRLAVIPRNVRDLSRLGWLWAIYTSVEIFWRGGPYHFQELHSVQRNP